MKESSWELLVSTLVVADIENPKLACGALSCIIAILIATLYFTVPIALNPPATIEVLCQITQTASPTIIIHNSTTQTISQATQIINSTTTEIASKVHCP